jgi:hypothetical protein
MFLNELRDSNCTRQASEEELTTSICVLLTYLSLAGVVTRHEESTLAPELGHPYRPATAKHHKHCD